LSGDYLYGLKSTNLITSDSREDPGKIVGDMVFAGVTVISSGRRYNLGICGDNIELVGAQDDNKGRLRAKRAKQQYKDGEPSTH
jgi:hypothetical protein